MPEEEKGFTVKDKRSFDDTGDVKNEVENEVKAEAPPKEKKAAQDSQDNQRQPFPEVNFSSLIFSLSSSALLHLGEIADPQTGEKKKDLDIAKHSIDTIALLKEKTKGNLQEDEEKFLETILTDLRWRYVNATG